MTDAIHPATATATATPFSWATATTEAKIAAINALAGQTFGDVAVALDITPTALHGFVFRNRDRVTRPPAKLTEWHRLGSAEARAAKVRELDDAGMSTRDIAALLGITAEWIVRVMTKRRDPVLNGGPRKKIGPSVPRFPVHPLPPAETWLPLDGRAAADSGGCQWPIEVDGRRQGCCGLDVHRRSFCERHYAVAYRVVERVVGE